MKHFIPSPIIGMGVPFSKCTFPMSIDWSTYGTFTRSSVGTYLTAAPTNGSSAFMASASSNVRRMEDRGDGSGSMLLLEGSRTNYTIHSANITGGWATSGLTATAGQSDPKGGTSAYRAELVAGGFCYETGVTPGSGYFTVSEWIRATSGTQTPNYWLYKTAAINTTLPTSIGTTYQRLSITSAYTGSDTTGQGCVDGRNLTSTGGVTSGARDVVPWGMQREIGAFATSVIETSNATFTRSADILTATYASLPPWIIGGKFVFTVAPVFSSADGINAASDQTIFSYAEDDSERILFVVTGGAMKLRVVSGGATTVESSALTFSAHQVLTVTVDTLAGAITVAGATTGNATSTGTSWTRPAASPTLYVGSRQGGTQNLFARLGSTYAT